MDIKRLRELSGVTSQQPPATTVAEVLHENQVAGVSAKTNQLRKMAGMAPLVEAKDVELDKDCDDSGDCDVKGCKCGGKKCDCGCDCECKNCTGGKTKSDD